MREIGYAVIIGNALLEACKHGRTEIEILDLYSFALQLDKKLFGKCYIRLLPAHVVYFLESFDGYVKGVGTNVKIVAPKERFERCFRDGLSENIATAMEEVGCLLWE